jgi:peptide/nickel transport system permease protein
LDYVLSKAAFSILTAFGVLVFNFLLFRIIPGDPVSMMLNPRMRPETRDKIREQFGLDKPIWFNLEAVRETGSLLDGTDSQIFRYFQNLARGNLGESFRQRRPVAELISNRLGPTVILILASEVVGITLGILLGLLAAWKRKTAIDTVATTVGLAAWALPPFWFGILLLILARGKLPMGGFVTPGAIYNTPFEQLQDMAAHVILPAATLAVLLFGSYMIIVRNSSLEVMAEDYILTAKAKGLSSARTLKDHVLKNASLPLVTIIAMDLGIALAGTIQIETIFSWPGLGRLMFDSIAQRDYPVLQGVFLLLAVSVIAANFLADLTYVALDPRVKA